MASLIFPTANRRRWHLYFPFYFLLSLLQYMPAHRLEPLNLNADSILLSGILAVATFELLFLRAGRGELSLLLKPNHNSKIERH